MTKYKVYLTLFRHEHQVVPVEMVPTTYSFSQDDLVDNHVGVFIGKKCISLLDAIQVHPKLSDVKIAESTPYGLMFGFRGDEQTKRNIPQIGDTLHNERVGGMGGTLFGTIEEVIEFELNDAPQPLNT